MASTPERPICDYEGYAYQEFWEGGRDYEDAVERVALSKLLPPRGGRLVEVGAGYGRLVPLYQGYHEVVLFDHALSQLREARKRWGSAGPGGAPTYRYVAGDFYELPFLPGVFDTVTVVRVLHHAADAPKVLAGVAKILGSGGCFVLEFANKLNLKASLRYLLRRQSWSPFESEPIEFMPLHYDFHPAWICEQLTSFGFEIEARRTVSHFRVGLLKKIVPTRLLVWLDTLCQPTGALWQLAPSVFVRSSMGVAGPAPGGRSIFRCVACGTGALAERHGELVCERCSAKFAITDGVYDLRAPIDKGAA